MPATSPLEVCGLDALIFSVRFTVVVPSENSTGRSCVPATKLLGAVIRTFPSLVDTPHNGLPVPFFTVTPSGSVISSTVLESLPSKSTS